MVAVKLTKSLSKTTVFDRPVGWTTAVPIFLTLLS
jgi:hypothetical protein